MNRQLKYWLEAIQIRWVIVGAILYLASALLLARLLIQPQYGRYHGAVSKQLEIDETYVDLIGLDVEDAVKNINHQLEELDSLKVQFEGKLLKSQRINSIFPTIDRFCTLHQLKVITLEPMNRSEQVGPDYEKHLLRLSALGKYADFLLLLDELENHTEWVLVESMNISPLENGTFARFDVVFSVLSQKEKKRA